MLRGLIVSDRCSALTGTTWSCEAMPFMGSPWASHLPEASTVIQELPSAFSWVESVVSESSAAVNGRFESSVLIVSTPSDIV